MLKKLDFFAININFLYNNKDIRYKTIFGGILSLTYCLVALIVFFVLLMQFLDRTRPVVYDQITKSAIPPQIILNKSFNIGIAISENHKFIDSDDLFDLEISYNRINNTNYENNLMLLSLERCSYDNFDTSHESFDDLNLGKAKCIDYPDDFNITLGGSIDSELYYYIKADLYLKNTVDRQMFQKRALENLINLHVYFTDSMYHLNNFTNTEIHFINADEITLSTLQFSEIDFELRSSNLTTDDSIFFESLTYNSMIELESRSFRAKINSNSSSLLATFKFSSSRNSHFIHRNYMEIGTFISKLASIINLMGLFFGFINFFYSKFVFFEELFNETIFVNKMTKKPTNNSKFMSSTVLNLMKQKDSNIKNVSEMHKLGSPQIVRNEQKFINLKKTKLSFVRNLMIQRLYCCFSKRKKLVFDLNKEIFEHYSKFLNFRKFFENSMFLEFLKKNLFDKRTLDVIRNINHVVPVKNEKIYNLIRELNLKDFEENEVLKEIPRKQELIVDFYNYYNNLVLDNSLNE